MTTEDLRMDACIEHKLVDVTEQGITEILAHSLALVVIKKPADMQISHG